MKHLRDAEIQNFLSGNADRRTSEHLKTCNGCQQQVNYYRVLFAQLEKQPSTSLPDDFAEAVLASVQERSGLVDRPAFQLLIAACVFIAGAGVTVRAAGVSFWQRIAAGSEILPSLSDVLAGALSQTNIDFELLGIGLLSLLILSMLERFVLRGEHAPG